MREFNAKEITRGISYYLDERHDICLSERSLLIIETLLELDRDSLELLYKFQQNCLHGEWKPAEDDEGVKPEILVCSQCGRMKDDVC